jgi:multiple sugar transport system permease protein
VPLAPPALLTVAVYLFLGSWNLLIWPLVMTNDTSIQPIEVGLAGLLTVNGIDWTDLAAEAVFTTLPIILLFLIVQRSFMEGVTRSGLKG